MSSTMAREIRGSLRPWRGPILLGLLALTLTAWAYAPALEAGFYFDDVPNIGEAEVTHWEELSWRQFGRTVSGGAIPSRWLANVTFGLDHLRQGLDPHGYHLTNVWIHLLVGMALVWLVVTYLGAEGRETALPDAVTAAALAALVFLVHPLNTQAVTYVVQRMASLAALFGILCFACYLRARRATSPAGVTGWLLAAAGLWVLALGSKETALALPVVCLAWEICFRRAAWVTRLRNLSGGGKLLGLLVLAGGLVGVAWWGRGIAGSIAASWSDPLPGREFSGAERVLTQARVQWLYVRLLLWPSPSSLNLEHDVAVSRGLFDPLSTALALGSWLVVAALAVALARRRPRYGFPVVAYLLLHGIESAPISLELVFEHRMYFPMAALALLTGVVVADAGRWRLAWVVGLSALLIPLVVATERRNSVWAGHLAFHYDCARKSPGKFRPQLNLGIELGKAGRVAEALPYFQAAVRIEPDNGKGRNQLGTAYLRLERHAEALPEFDLAVRYEPENAYARYNLAYTLDTLGRPLEAIPHYRAFLQLEEPKLASFRPGVARRLGELTGGSRSLSR